MAGQSFGPCSCPSELPETGCHLVDCIVRSRTRFDSRSYQSRSARAADKSSGHANIHPGRLVHRLEAQAAL